MADEGKRIFWSEFEQAEVYRVFVDLLGQKKIDARPVPNEYSKEGSLVMNLLRQAQLVLPEKRRRPLGNIDAVPRDLGKRLADNGLFPKNWNDFYKKTKAKRAEPEVEVDSNLIRIQELERRISIVEEERDAEKRRADWIQNEMQTMQRQLSEARPDKVLLRFFSDLAAEAIRKSRSISEQANTAQMEAMRRATDKPPAAPPAPKHDSAQVEPVKRKPKFLIIGGYGDQHTAIHEGIKDFADGRYLESTTATGRLRQGAADAYKDRKFGTVIQWASNIGHDVQHALDAKGIPYERFFGSISKMIDFIKEKVEAQVQ